MTDSPVAALRRIEQLEADLHTREDPDADAVSDLRLIAGGLLMNEAYASMVAENHEF